MTREIDGAITRLKEDIKTGYWDRQSEHDLNTLLKGLDGIWHDGYAAGFADALLGSTEGWDKKVGETR